MFQISKDEDDIAGIINGSLLGYATYMFPNYISAKHHVKIAEALEAVERGEITRLVITMPPRAGKTMLVSEFFPAWYLGRNPDHQIIAATYSHDKAGDTGRKIRNQLLEPDFKAAFPGCGLSPDSKGANKLSTIQGGVCVSVGIGGAITGRGAHVFLIDDPIKSREEADSERVRERLISWYKGVVYTRLMGKNAIVVIQTRWHFYDLVGFLLDKEAEDGDLVKEKWTVLDLPAVANSDDDLLGRKFGESIWPDYAIFDLERLKETKRVIGTREWNAQYQQQPIAEEGGMVQLNWFKRYNHREKHRNVRKIVCSWDTAFKEKQLNDPSCGTIWAIIGNDFYLLDVINKHLAYPKLKKLVISVYEKYQHITRASVPVLIEDAASGQSLIQELKQDTMLPIIKVRPDANKKTRLSEVTSLIEAGRVYLPDEAHWLTDYETQLCRFPFDRFDDMVDSTSQFLRWAGKPKFKRRRGKNLFWK